MFNIHQDAQASAWPVIDPALLTEKPCPACGFQFSAPFYTGTTQPLVTNGRKSTSPSEAQALPRLPLDFVRCLDCGHVHNKSFSYDRVPYADKPSYVYNQGDAWRAHLGNTLRLVHSLLGKNPLVLEIGCGDAFFLKELAELQPAGRYIGYDPAGADGTANVEIRRSYFDPVKDLAAPAPDVILLRHILEHFENPLAFLQRFAAAATLHQQPVTLYVEVPAIDNAITAFRTADFYFEHHNQFTLRSFQVMLERAGGEVLQLWPGFDGEVACAVVRFAPARARRSVIDQAANFERAAKRARVFFRMELLKRVQAGRRVALWGGAGRGAAFINRFNLDAEHFPLVIDSDPHKVGAFVPGTGQVIQHSSVLVTEPADVIVIGTAVRAKDIVLEMATRGIRAKEVLLEHAGRLVDYHTGQHPYRL